MTNNVTITLFILFFIAAIIFKIKVDSDPQPEQRIYDYLNQLTSAEKNEILDQLNNNDTNRAIEILRNHFPGFNPLEFPIVVALIRKQSRLH